MQNLRSSSSVLPKHLCLTDSQKIRHLKIADLPKNANRPIILALGGGGARGAAIAGALSVLFEEGIRPDYIVGCSMGFVVGGLLASGMRPAEICGNFENGNIMDAFLPVSPLVRLLRAPLTLPKHLFGGGDYDGLYNGNKLRSWLNKSAVAGKTKVEEFRIPVSAVTFNLLTGKSELMNKGEFGLLGAATTAVPALFRPVEIGNGLYLDGGVLDNLPVRMAKEIAQEIDGIVIAVTVNEPYEKNVPAKQFRKMGSATFRILSAHHQLTDVPQEDLADVVIRANNPVTLISKSKNDIDSAIKLGKSAAKEALPKIRECLLGFSCD